MSAADRIEQLAAEWLTRRESEDWSDADEAALEAWLAETRAHQVAFWRLEHGWEKVARLAALRGSQASAAAQSRPLLWRAGVAAAAVFAAAVVLGVVFPQFGPGSHTFETALGGRETVPLADGSRIELNTDSEVRTHVTARVREVWLDRGEAFFDVKHDPKRPFVVWAGARKVTVLGTKFSVRRDGDLVRVAVLEGHVRVEPPRTRRAKPEILIPGEIVTAQGQSDLVQIASVERVSGELGWRQGMLIFDQKALGDVAVEFNRYNTTQLKVADPATAQIRIGGAFEARNVEAFARLLRSAYGLKVARNGNDIEISN